MTRRYDATLHVDRRDFLMLGAGAFLSVVASWRRTTQQPDSLPGTGSSGRLWDPARAGRPLPPVTAADNDAGVQAIEKQIHCTCGCNLDVYTCRTTDFTCTVSPAMHQRVIALAQQGQSGEQILDQFVREHGIAILMAPPKRGFNLAGYFVPSLLIVVAGVALTLVLRRWVRAGRPAAAAAPLGDAGATPEELARLRRELERLSS
ncbi:MAG TPA: cytochrome c-type biogenesis protein CcmH [Gemmatimonadales bacterium]|nr:cytochrome c-type biogenesis protein CcmH [Gemmatimonadales bacterium]